MSDIETDNSKWSVKALRAIIDLHYVIWKQRCIHLHTAAEDDGVTLTRNEAIREIQKVLQTPRKELSVAEKDLHRNVRRYLHKGTENTLVHWSRLLRSVREEEIVKKRKSSISRDKLQSITKFFRRRKN